MSIRLIQYCLQDERLECRPVAWLKVAVDRVSCLKTFRPVVQWMVSLEHEDRHLNVILFVDDYLGCPSVSPGRRASACRSPWYLVPGSKHLGVILLLLLLMSLIQAAPETEHLDVDC